jgi:hypothetical protein
MKITVEDIKIRKSVRTYDDSFLDPVIKEKLLTFIRSNKKGPFGHEVRFDIIDLNGAGQEELKQLASYGNIKGAKYFMAGVIKKTATSVIDYGYLTEKNILAATSLGIGTVWVGGTFNRAGFMEKINAKEGEVIPAVVPMGYAAKHKDVMEISTRLAVTADTRKPWKEIFFDAANMKPLSEGEAGDFNIPLSCLRLAPSASNKQPWRVIVDKKSVHLFLERTAGYGRVPMEDMQLMDMGIAMCNFDIAASENGLTGKWDAGSKIKGKDAWEYIATFK